jgi:hypothetical protein
VTGAFGTTFHWVGLVVSVHVTGLKVKSEVFGLVGGPSIRAVTLRSKVVARLPRWVLEALQFNQKDYRTQKICSSLNMCS